MARDRIEAALGAAISGLVGGKCPPQLAAALRHAVLRGGGRVRPQLCVAVATAHGDPRATVTNAAAVALELIHCASLVHDDLPCFDAADLRRDAPSVHRAFGEAIAVLTGDALIAGAFETLARSGAGKLLAPLMSELAAATGSARGIIAGQAWESEPAVDLQTYHRYKASVLFEAAAAMGALSAGAPVSVWREVGRQVGLAYQLADDIADCVSTPSATGKPTGRDAALARPNAVHALGLPEALHRFDCALERAAAAVPLCRRRDEVVKLVRRLGAKLCPPELRALAHVAARTNLYRHSPVAMRAGA